MKIFKRKYIVLIYAAIIILAGAGVLITAVMVAQGAEENRLVAEQSENIVLRSALATPAATATPVSATAQAVVTETGIPASATPLATETETAAQTSDPTMNALNVPGPEFITEDEAKEAYIESAKDIFGMNADKSELTASFYTETAPHEWWYVTGNGKECYIDAVSGEVLQFRLSPERKYTGKLITLEECTTDPYSADIAEDPNNAYSRMAAEIVNSTLADGRIIDEIMTDGIQFVWDNNSDGLDPKAKGTIAVDVLVLMKTGRSYRFTFWGTEEIVLMEFSSHPTQDACRWYYFYEEQAEEYSGHA